VRGALFCVTLRESSNPRAVPQRPKEEERVKVAVLGQDGGLLGRLDDPGVWMDERLSGFFASSGIGQVILLALGA